MTELTPATEASQSLDVATEQPAVTEATQSEVKPVEAQPLETPAVPVREKVKIKVDKDEFEIDPYSDEALSYLRKGKAADRVFEQRDKLKSTVDNLDEIAKELGYSDHSQYLMAAKEQLRLQRLQTLQEMEPEQLAKEALRSRQLEEELNSIKSKYVEQERQDTEFFMFKELFPDVKEAEIPDDVWDSFKKGGSLVEGYRQHRLETQQQRIAELEKELQIHKQNKANEASAVPSFIGKGAEQENLYSVDDITTMSTEDIAKNWNLIQKSLKKIRGQ